MNVPQGADGVAGYLIEEIAQTFCIGIIAACFYQKRDLIGFGDGDQAAQGGEDKLVVNISRGLRFAIA